MRLLPPLINIPDHLLDSGGFGALPPNRQLLILQSLAESLAQRSSVEELRANSAGSEQGRASAQSTRCSRPSSSRQARLTVKPRCAASSRGPNAASTICNYGAASRRSAAF